MAEQNKTYETGLEGYDRPWQYKEVLEELYLTEDLTGEEIAKRLGCSRATVVNWIRKHDIPHRGHPDDTQRHPRDKPWHDKENLKNLYHNEELSIDEIADRLGCSKGTVGNWVNRHGISHRGRPLSRRAKFRTNKQGYEVWKGNRERLRVHTLLAIADGADPHALFSDPSTVIHHKNEIPWDNRTGNIEVLDTATHSMIHTDHPLDAPWRDKTVLSRAYKNATMEMLSEKWGCAESTIYYWIDKFGIETRPRSDIVSQDGGRR